MSFLFIFFFFFSLSPCALHGCSELIEAKNHRYLRLILLGAFFSTCSQPYLGHLTLLRPYSPSTLPKKLTSYLFTLLLVPSFLLVHLPSRLLGLRWGRLGTWARRAQEGVLGLLERGLRARVGSGYFNEGEGASAVGRSGESKGRVKDQ